MKLFMCLIIVVLSAYIGRLLSKKTVLRLSYFREYQSAHTSSVTCLIISLRSIKTYPSV